MTHPSEEDLWPLGDDSGLRAVGQARNVTRGFLALAAPEGEDAVDTVLLVMSELFTNAVRHAGGATGFRLEAGPGTVTVAVHDASTVSPRSLPPDLTRQGGFGWLLVQELTVDVRVEVRAAGKTVAAVVPCPTAVTSHS
ncbi:ATP-binding protein [Streptomyces sp. NPDC088794]|uniref:ATP-binding protein n=1 Tax=Streptomyces sp. NPDC088794 TaxID=3365902 RepID=UPI003807A858